MDPQAPLYKLVLFGKATVGKTSLFAWTLGKPFEVNVAMTVAVMYATRCFDVDGHSVNAQIWDTAGQERFASITKGYFQDASGGLAVFDLTDADTLETLKPRISVFNQTARPGAVVVLVGNKTDLVGERQVSREQGETAARQLGAVYVETSAKDVQGVEEAFTVCVREVVKKVGPSVRAMSIVLTDTTPAPSKSKCCK